MKKMFQKTAVAACVAAIVFTGSSLAAQAAPETTLSAYKTWGNIAALDEDTLLYNNLSPQCTPGEIIIHVSEDTKILDAVNGFPVSMDSITPGEIAYAYVGPIMTMSLPPQTTSPMVLTDIPADYKVPDYITVKSLEDQGENYLLTSVDGLEFTVPKDCIIIPYLTRNMVYLENLTEGRTCLVWSDAASVANRIVLFAPDADEESQTSNNTAVSGPENETEKVPVSYGWFEENGSIYFRNQDGTLAKGFIQTGDQIFFLDLETGAVQTGLVTIGDTTYDMHADGTFTIVE